MLELKVWGKFACFTRPENKVERVSYDVMTPSAARGALEAVLWKPEFDWLVQEIWVLNPIKHFSILRNEVNTLASARAAQSWEKNGGNFFADADRAQRNALVLRDVAYLIRADIRLRPHAADPPKKYKEMFERRVEKGQARHQPYLGTREFSAFFSAPDGAEKPQPITDDLGRMLLDLDFTLTNKGRVTYRQHDENGARWVEGKATPRFFDAALHKGVLRVPSRFAQGEG